MSTPIIFFIFPLAISILLFLLQKKNRLVILTGIVVCVVLALFGYFQNFGGVLKIGALSVEIKTTLFVFGRSFILSNEDRFFLVLVYSCTAIWFIASSISVVSIRMISLGLAIVSLLTAARAVEPFLYAAILVEIAVIIAIPMIMNRGKPVGKGILRFLIFQTLAMPLILFGGWLLGGVQASTSDSSRQLQAALFLGIGFSFWLAVFPFQGWVAQLTKEIHPVLSGFILGLFPVVSLLLMVDFISGLVWLRESTFLHPVLKLVGAIMIVSTGVWAVFEKDVRRMIGYTVLLESGFALILVSMQSEIGVKILLISLVPRLVALVLMSFSIAIFIQNELEPTLKGLNGILRKLPFASLGLLISLLSVVGFPLFAGFPVRLASLEQLVKIDPVITIWVMTGIVLFFISIVRLFASFGSPIFSNWQRGEKVNQIVFILCGIFVLTFWGVFSSLFSHSLDNIIINLPMLR
ncbi:MAG: proton-conducting transporter membrane subunit [Chloroflexi bacterium]|nr:proton-conducting transporter membrane subunit [Chloroflexota bacterium]